MPSARPIKERMLEKINKADSGCWEWTSALDNHGYAVISKHNKAAKAYREMYKLFIGPIPEGMCVLHKCDNRKCVNPDHLYIGTKSDNMMDRAYRNPDNQGGVSRKLSQGQADEIRLLHKKGVNWRILCKRFDISNGTLYRIIRGDCY